MESLELSGNSFDINTVHKRYKQLSKHCAHTLNQILKNLTSKTTIQECFPAETFGNSYIEIRELLIEIADLLRNLVQNELADSILGDDLENKLNVLDEIIAISIAKQKQFKDLVETKGWESNEIKQILEEELVNVQDMSVDEVVRFAEYCNMKNILQEVEKRRTFLEEVTAKLESEVVNGLDQITSKHNELQKIAKETVLKFEDETGENSDNVYQMRKALLDYVETELNFEEEDKAMLM